MNRNKVRKSRPRAPSGEAQRPILNSIGEAVLEWTVQALLELVCSALS